MVLLHFLSWITGPEGIAIEEFGRIFAECTLCDRFVFVENQEEHACVESSGLTRGFTERGAIAPLALLRFLVEYKGSLSKGDVHVLFALCTGCNFIVHTAVGADHPTHCRAMMTPCQAL
jgi:hypothetical protein